MQSFEVKLEQPGFSSHNIKEKKNFKTSHAFNLNSILLITLARLVILGRGKSTKLQITKTAQGSEQ